jgi:hypothetical protein
MDYSRKYTHSTDVTTSVGTAQLYKISGNAELPKLHESLNEDGEHDIGFYWDIFANDRPKKRNGIPVNGDLTGEMNTFLTGFSIIPPPGFHFEIVAHPELTMSGYAMFDHKTIYSSASPSQEITLNLYKFRDGDDLQLPHPIGRMFLRENYTTQVNLIRSEKTVNKPIKKPQAYIEDDFDYEPQQVPIATRKTQRYQGGLA